MPLKIFKRTLYFSLKNAEVLHYIAGAQTCAKARNAKDNEQIGLLLYAKTKLMLMHYSSQSKLVQTS